MSLNDFINAMGGGTPSAGANPRRELARHWAAHLRRAPAPAERADSTPTLKPSRYNILVRLADGGALLFNSLTRALARLDADEAALAQCWMSDGGPLAPAPAQALLIGTLSADGYLVPRDCDEVTRAEDAFNAERRSTQTLGLTIAPTMNCNLACGYCFQGHERSNETMSAEVAEGIKAYIARQLAGLSLLSITWYGGEPLMGKKHIVRLSREIIAMCQAAGVSYSSMMATNGYLLTPKVAKQLQEAGCSSVQVTIDGLRETHDAMRPVRNGRGSFDKIIGNVDRVIEETGLGINLRINVGARNIEECAALLEEFATRKLNRKGTFSIYFAPITASTPEAGTAFDEGLSGYDYNTRLLALERRARELGLSPQVAAPQGILGMCVAPRDNGILVIPNGDVHKCWDTAHDASKRIGSILDPERLFESANAKLWAAWSPYDNDVCRNCAISPLCGGMCAHRFVYADIGGKNALPCPSWKWSTAENLFERARGMGIVSDADWLPEEATVRARQSGAGHSRKSLLDAQRVLMTKLPDVDRESLEREVRRVIPVHPVSA